MISDKLSRKSSINTTDHKYFTYKDMNMDCAYIYMEPVAQDYLWSRINEYIV